MSSFDDFKKRHFLKDQRLKNVSCKVSKILLTARVFSLIRKKREEEKTDLESELISIPNTVGSIKENADHFFDLSKNLKKSHFCLKS